MQDVAAVELLDVNSVRNGTYGEIPVRNRGAEDVLRGLRTEEGTAGERESGIFENAVGFGNDDQFPA